MTDLGETVNSLPARLGVTGRYVDESLILDLTPQPAVLHHGAVRASVVSYIVDAVAGIVVDDDPDQWTLTSDMTVRMRAVPAPDRISAANTVLRNGRRSVTCAVELTATDDLPIGSAAIGFAKVARRDSDPPKPSVAPGDVEALFRLRQHLSTPLRDEAGIERVSPADGVVELLVTPYVRNPAGTLQGAMVALVAEAATEDLVEERFGVRAVVTDLDIRYLGQAPVGPVRTRSVLLGPGPTDPVRVELIDTSADRITTLVFARAATLH